VVQIKDNVRLSRAQTVSGAASLVSYALGYPVAIFAHSAIGWVLVMLGGFFLFFFGIVTIRRIHRGSQGSP
jgi:hypothetical protein